VPDQRVTRPLKKLTGKAAKRVELAQDVIAQIQLRQVLLNIKQGTYVRATLKAEGEKVIDTATVEEDEVSADIDVQADPEERQKLRRLCEGSHVRLRRAEAQQAGRRRRAERR
jgi:hypothetical protein